ncbi:MAG: hypothetical protein NVV83_15610 [Afipia sp.]|nr:hypothetical protein [Afipia sp.]
MAAHIPDASSSGIDLDVLFRRYAGELQQHAFRRLKDREAAADVVQDLFCSPFALETRSLPGFLSLWISVFSLENRRQSHG